MRQLLLAGLVALGLALRALPLTANRFHPDEALYASFGRLIATGRDPMLASVIVDKPPLPYYTLGGSLYLAGPSELAARLPALYASAASLALLYSAVRRLYGRESATMALLAFSLSPFAISFAATAFVDPLQLAFLLWAVAEAAGGRWGRAGVAAGLALACKQTTLAFLPLVVWLLLRHHPPTLPHGSTRPPTPRLGQAALFLAPILLVIVLISVWDLNRSATVGFWEQGYTDNAPTRLAYPAEVGPRFAEIGRLLAYATGSPVANAVFAPGLLALLWPRARSATDDARRRLDAGFAAFIAVYVAAYGLLALNLWDRYLLALVPFICLLLGRGALRLAGAMTSRPARYAAPILAALLLPGAWTAARSGIPVGGDHGAYDGIDVVARYLAEKPTGSVLYDHWLSWELRYYLDDAPIYLVWMPDPATLATDLRAFGHSSPRYFVSPSWESDAAMQEAAGEAGFAFRPVFSTVRRDGSTSFIVYRIVPAAG